MVYKQNEEAKHIYIVVEGEFELFQNKSDSLKERLSEIKYLPKQARVSLLTAGSLAGEEDILNKELYSSSLRCNSIEG